MKHLYSKISLAMCTLLIGSTNMFAGPPPPPSGVPIDESVWIVFGVGLLAGILRIRKSRQK